MSNEVSDKLRRQGNVIVGNVERKDELTNPISRWFVNGFDRTLMQLVKRSLPTSIHEVGCGEGRLAELIAASENIPFRASDLSVEISQDNMKRDSPVVYVCRSVYDLVPGEDDADLVLCCEVLEHVDDPEKALRVLRGLGARHYIFSVPREPMWRIMNMCRGKYLRDLGNTPGHINHWGKSSFLKLLQNNGFNLIDVRSPVPWSFALCARS